MNRFHWHLTDDQGWRIEIKSLPKLTAIGAWRVDRNDKFGWQREFAKPGEKATYSGFYTQTEIKDIIQYARERYITIIPEIDMPGHSRAFMAAYPQVSCDGGPYQVAFKLLSEAGTADIHYSLDGSEPTQSSELYQSPIKLNHHP